MSTLYSVSLDTDGGGWNGYTSVMTFATAALTIPSWSISKIRVTFQAGNAEALTITNAYVSHAAAAGDAYDSAETPIQLLFSGSGTKAISAGQQAVSDWISFVYNKTSSLLISAYTNGGASVDTYRYKTGLGANIQNYYRAATNEAGTQNRTTGYTNTSGQNLGIATIEVDTDSGGFVIFFQ